MIARVTMLAALALAGCNFGNYEPSETVVVHGKERVRVAEMSEQGDAWLYGHCVFKGSFVTLGDDGAKEKAIIRGANFVEPMGERTSWNNGVKLSLSATFASFYCPAFPPGLPEEKS